LASVAETGLQVSDYLPSTSMAHSEAPPFQRPILGAVKLARAFGHWAGMSALEGDLGRAGSSARWPNRHFTGAP
jgi:hypothetical protein